MTNQWQVASIGIHPIEVKRALLEFGDEKLLEKALGSLKVTTPLLLEVARDDNPVLSFWPFTPACGQQIEELIPQKSSVALLGVPTLFKLLKNPLRSEIKLFDSDSYLFSHEITRDYVQCDVLSTVTSQFENTFDVVLTDPPWYLNEYRPWIVKSASLARPGGTVIFVLFPQCIRSGAEGERDAILALAHELFDDIEMLQAEARYETPSFEKVELLRNGLDPADWRKATFVRGRVKSPKKTVQMPSTRVSADVWSERRVGCGRIFVNNKAAKIAKFLETADPTNRFLSSPSRRDPARQRANVISSRGHALCCRDPEKLLYGFDRIRSIGDIGNIALSLEPDSADLFKSVAHDLWPRFLVIA